MKPACPGKILNSPFNGIFDKFVCSDHLNLEALRKHKSPRDIQRSAFALTLLIALGVSVLPKTPFHTHSDQSILACPGTQPEFLALLADIAGNDACEDHEEHLQTTLELCELCDFTYHSIYTYTGNLSVKPIWFHLEKDHITSRQPLNCTVPSTDFNKGSPSVS